MAFNLKRDSGARSEGWLADVFKRESWLQLSQYVWRPDVAGGHKRILYAPGVSQGG